MTAPEATALTTVDVTPRDLHFSRDGLSARDWLGGDPVGTAVFNALSLVFPDGERMFMDAVRQQRPVLSGRLAEDARAFIAQEAIHSREHVGLNAILDRNHYPVESIEAEVRRRTDVIRAKGPMAMLAVTIALEHFTAMMADLFLVDSDLFEGAPAEMVRMWRWHAMEETEHKAVAFDVFLEATRDWSPARRLGLRRQIMGFVTVMFTRNITHYAARLLEADGMGAVQAHVRVLWYLFGKPGVFRRSWRTYFDWFRADFHPWNHDNRQLLDHWRGVFAPVAQPHAA